MSIRPGIRLGERYQLLAPIAAGGMGQVWRAEDTTLHRVVAAKILRSEFSGDDTFLARFRAEARNTASLSHPNIASVYDYGEQVQDSERLCYLVMELVDGKPLVDVLARERRLSPSRTLDYLEQTAMGLAAAHREGMVHRDIKPGNLIIRSDGVLKITDFGIARAANSVALTERGTVVGTAQYLAPEQAEGKPARPASDIYALGVVGYECLAGFRPFDGDNSIAIALSQIRDAPRPLPADIPPHVRALIEITMRKNPDARYQDGARFVQVIKAVRAGAMPMPPPALGGRPAGPPARLPGQPIPPGAGRPGFPAGPNVMPPAGGTPNAARVAPTAQPAGRPTATAPNAPPPNAAPPPAPNVAPAAATPRAAPPNLAAPIDAPAPSAAPPYATGTYQAGTGTYPRASASGTFGVAPRPPQSGTARPDTDPAANRRRTIWMWIVFAALLIGAVIAVLVVLLGGSSDELSAPMNSTTTILDLKESLR